MWVGGGARKLTVGSAAVRHPPNLTGSCQAAPRTHSHGHKRVVAAGSFRASRGQDAAFEEGVELLAEARAGKAVIAATPLRWRLPESPRPPIRGNDARSTEANMLATGSLVAYGGEAARQL